MNHVMNSKDSENSKDNKNMKKWTIERIERIEKIENFEKAYIFEKMEKWKNKGINKWTNEQMKEWKSEEIRNKNTLRPATTQPQLATTHHNVPDTKVAIDHDLVTHFRWLFFILWRILRGLEKVNWF